MYRQGQGGPQDADRATALYKKGCDLGFAPACQMARFDSMAARPEVTITAEEFLAPLESACDAGAAWGCTQVAEI